MIAAALAGVVIAALGAIAYIAHIENKHDDERDGCERLPRTPGTAPRARHGRQEQGRQGREEGAEAASGRQPERAHAVRPAAVVAAVSRTVRRRGHGAGAEKAAAESRIDVPGPVRLSPEGKPPAGPGTTSGPGPASGKGLQSPIDHVLAARKATSPATTGTPGSEACDACTANQCGPGCQCSCHWGTTAEHAWAALTAEPGWGEPDWCGDLDAEAFATDDLLIRAGELLGAGT